MCDPITAVLGIGSMVLGGSQKAPPPPPPVKPPASAQDSVASASGADVRFGDDRKKTVLEKEKKAPRGGRRKGDGRRLKRLDIIGTAKTPREVKRDRKLVKDSALRDSLLGTLKPGGAGRPTPAEDRKDRRKEKSKIKPSVSIL